MTDRAFFSTKVFTQASTPTICKNSVFKDQEFVFKIWQKSSKQKIAGLHPAPPPYGAAPLPPTHVGTKFLAAVVLDNQDRALHLSQFSQKFSQTELFSAK